jgi:hypothetical protein
MHLAAAGEHVSRAAVSPSKESGVVVENVVPADAAGAVVPMSTPPMISVVKAKLVSRNPARRGG